MEAIRFVLLAALLAFVPGCTPPPPQAVTHPVEFTVSWENSDSFEDLPEFDDRELDKSLERFQHVGPEGTKYYFTDGTVTVELPEGPDEQAVRAVAHSVAREALPIAEAFRKKDYYIIHEVLPSRFGYFVDIEWGSPEEDYRGHGLWMMVDLPRRHIWWNRCD
jgi:hypothetical protein